MCQESGEASALAVFLVLGTRLLFAEPVDAIMPCKASSAECRMLYEVLWYK